MTPYDQAAQVYEQEECVHTFLEDLEYYHRYGYVFSTPDYFVMGRPVCRDWPPEWIVNPIDHHADIQCDLINELTLPPNLWHIALMSGDTFNVWETLPYRLPGISIEKRNKLKFYSYDRLQRPFIHQPI